MRLALLLGNYYDAFAFSCGATLLSARLNAITYWLIVKDEIINDRPLFECFLAESEWGFYRMKKGLQRLSCKPLSYLVRPKRFELLTPWFVVLILK